MLFDYYIIYDQKNSTQHKPLNIKLKFQKINLVCKKFSF
jgi:hypothetical protein